MLKVCLGIIRPQNRREKPPTFLFGIVFTSIRAKIGKLATHDDCETDLDALVQPVKGSSNYLAYFS
jgi:hypothetical protein